MRRDRPAPTERGGRVSGGPARAYIVGDSAPRPGIDDTRTTLHRVHQTVPPRPLLSRVLDTFVAPRRLFAGFGESAPWADVLLVATAGAVILAAVQPAEVFLAQMEDPVTRRGAPVEITSPPADIVRYGRMLAALSALAGHPLITFALAGIISLLFGVLGGGRAGFRPYLAIAAHALLVPVAGLLVLRALGVALDRPLEPTLGALLPGRAEPGALGAFLSGVSILQVWMLVVIAVGISELNQRRSWAGAALLLIGLYLSLGLITALLLGR